MALKVQHIQLSCMIHTI